MTIQGLIGSTYGRLTIIGELPRTKHNKRVVVQCSCGVTKEVILGSLRYGRTTSCGCLKREQSTTHGLTDLKDQLYRAWSSMKARCKDPHKHRYGGRGITVCDEWLNDYPGFRAWSLANGYQPGLTLDRRDNNLGYSPSNCRWTDQTTQSRNRNSIQGSSSQYIGVYRCTKRQAWVAQVTVDKKKKTIGRFDDEHAAARARNEYIVAQGLQNFTMNNVPP